jgi:nucleoside-diphosphate-sugar epimerase
MRLLIIGGGGFIGRHLVPRLLAAGHEVAVVRRSEDSAIAAGAHPIRADRRELTRYAVPLRDFAPEVVVDLVLSSGRQAADLVALFAGHARRVVGITSADVYRAAAILHGFDRGPLEPLPLTESSALRQTGQTYPPAQIEALKQVFAWLDDEYDKVAVESSLRARAELPATVLRLPMIYGPGDQLHRLYPIIRRVDDGRPAIYFADAVAAWRAPRGYVENVAAAIALAATSERAAGRTYNVAERPSFSELEWTRQVTEVMGWNGSLVTLPMAAAPPHLRLPARLEQHWVVDSTRIRAELGYAEPVPLSEALDRTIAWERANPPVFNPAAFDYAAEDAAARAPAIGEAFGSEARSP